MTGSFLTVWFGWPNGAVLTNLVASAIWLGFAAWRLLRKMNAIHEHVQRVHDHVKLVHQHQIDHAPKRKKAP